ncbi:MAG: carboxymuconolactone decarboxylase family protein [Fuerstiella sp.]
MAYVEPLDKLSAPNAAHDLLNAIEEKYGKVLNIFGTLAYQPDVLRGVVSINEGLQNNLPARLRELAYFKASQVNNCEYCSHYHSKAALNAGLTTEQLRASADFADSDQFSEAEKSVLQYTEELTAKGNVSAETVAAVKEHIGDTELVTLAATVAMANFTNRFNHGLGIALP